MPTDRLAWTPAMRSPLVEHDDALLIFERDDAQHWPGLYGTPPAESCGFCARWGVGLRLTEDRAQVSCGDCLAALVAQDAKK